MYVETMVGGAVVVAVLWVPAIYFDKLQRVSDAWWPATDAQVRLRPLLRVSLKVLAVAASVGYGVVLVAFVAG